MTIRELAREYKNEIMDGIAWVAIWKVGRQWNATSFYLDCDTDRIEPDELEFATDILAKDENAILINEYYCAHMGDGTLEDIVAGIRFHYNHGYNMLKTSTAYTEALEAQQAAQDPAEADDRIGQQLEEFLQTEAGEEMKETIRLWDRVLTRQEGEKKDHASNVCGAKWEVFKMFLKQLYGIEFFFTRTDEYFGICTEDERIFLMKERRGGTAR